MRSVLELVITGVPFVVLWVSAWWALSISYWLTLAISVPAGAFLMRLFLIKHDCGHGAFFRRRIFNDWVGRVLGVLTLTPYDVWRRSHAMHHANSGNLDKRGLGDVNTLTVAEYRELPRFRRIAYRIYRHPVVMFGVGPAYLFFLRHRLPRGISRGDRRFWISTMGTNAAIALVVGTLIFFLGAGPVLLVLVPTTFFAALMCTRTFEPDSVDTIRRVSGGKVVLWYGDAPANLKRDHVVSGEYDAVFAKDPDLVRRLKQMLGLDAHPLAEACNPAWHRPVAQRRGNTLVVAGSSYGYRNALVRRLLAAGEQVKLYGPPPSIWVPRDVAAAHTNRFLDQDTKAQVFGEALACLTSFALSEGANSVNCRVFETCACGAVALAEEREAIGRYFERDREYLAYGSMEECLEQLARLRADESGARELRRRASERAHGEHTYRHRLESMLATLDLEPR